MSIRFRSLIGAVYVIIGLVIAWDRGYLTLSC